MEEVQRASQTPSRLTSISGRISLIEQRLNTVMFLVMLVLMFVQVLSRYVIHHSLNWSEEVIRYMFIVTTYLGAAIATEKAAHIEVDVWPLIMAKLRSERVKVRLEQGIAIISNSICLAFTLMFAWLLLDLVRATHASGQVSPALKIPMSLISGAMLVSAMFMAFHWVVNITQTAMRSYESGG